ncbi:MAG: glycosyltransferase [Microbacteriaceae bacterium]
MRILLATAGSRGDIEPFAALTRRAMAEGHDVRLVVPDNSGADLSGIDVVSMGVDFTHMIEDQGVSLAGTIRAYRSVVRPIMNAVIVQSARAAIEYQPDVIVSHPKVLSVPIIAEALGIPHVVVEIVPAMTPTRSFPAAGTTTHNLGALNRVTYQAAAASVALFRTDLDQVAKILGTSRRRTAPPAATLMPISPAILERPLDYPKTVHLTGPWRTDTVRNQLSDEVTSFITGGEFVYAGFGSMAAGDPVDRAREVIGGIREFGARALIVTGLGGLTVAPQLRGEDVLVVRSVDHELVLPQAAAAVHHGGIGTVQAATRAGTVSIIVPFIADQPFWGARMHSRALAPAPIPQRRLNSARLAARLDDSENYRAEVEVAARSMAEDDGTGTALTVIASVL